MDSTVRRSEHPTVDDEQFIHRFCDCDDLEALCGKYKTVWNAVPKSNDGMRCTVCREMERNACYRCRK